jgi:succinate dehydrogenase/fumarate reductase flavoprotein subunit
VAGETFRAAGVVVATGGFARNRDLIAAHYPDGLAGGDWTGSPAGDGSRGDALELAGQVGADLLGDGRARRCGRGSPRSGTADGSSWSTGAGAVSSTRAHPRQLSRKQSPSRAAGTLRSSTRTGVAAGGRHRPRW